MMCDGNNSVFNLLVLHVAAIKVPLMLRRRGRSKALPNSAQNSGKCPTSSKLAIHLLCMELITCVEFECFFCFLRGQECVAVIDSHAQQEGQVASGGIHSVTDTLQ